VKVSISLPDDDVAFIDTYAERQGYPSRSAVLQQAVRLLRAAELGPAYDDAFTDWETSDDAVLWETTSADGRG
jgi:Arc/MetJ-type ribon-helix-helix transcriptional regulator